MSALESVQDTQVKNNYPPFSEMFMPKSKSPKSFLPQFLSVILAGAPSPVALMQPLHEQDCTLDAARVLSAPAPTMMSFKPRSKLPPSWLTLAPAPYFGRLTKVARTSATSSAMPSSATQPSPSRTPYSIPFGLRPAVAVNALRLDSSLALFTPPSGNASSTNLVTTLLVSRKLNEATSVVARVGMVRNAPPESSTGVGPATAFLNPVFGVNHVHVLHALRITPFIGVALPLGSGGGSAPDPASSLARTQGVWTRSSMDNAMFAVNDLVVFPGIDVAFVHSGWTVQLEATLLQLRRVRGSDRVQPDALRTNFTAGLHAGYFLGPALSLGAELRHQRWLSTPKAVEVDSSLRDTTTVALGPRVHIKLDDSSWLRPGVSYSLPLDNPMASSSYQVIQLDVPFIY